MSKKVVDIGHPSLNNAFFVLASGQKGPFVSLDGDHMAISWKTEEKVGPISEDDNMGQDPTNLACVTIKVERQKSGAYVATSPEIRGLTTEGATLGEVLHNLTTAYELAERWQQKKREENS